MCKNLPDHPYVVWDRKYKVETAPERTAYFKARDAHRADYERRGLSEIGAGSYRHTELLAYEILSIPAVTLAGVMVKVRLGEWFGDGDEYGMAEMNKSVIADIEAMAGGQANA